MPASLAPVLDLIHCPDCGTSLEAADDVVCTTGHRFDLIAGMTIASPLPAVGPGGRGLRRAATRLSGLRYLGADELGDLCAAAGLHGFRTTRRGAALLFVAEAPG